MINLVLIGLGGSLGAISRFMINDFLKNLNFMMLPTGIMLVNIIGCFFIGIAMAQIIDHRSSIYFFIVVGFLGSFTTMSAFSEQTIEMLYNGKEFVAFIYVIASITSCLIATYLAYILFRAS